MANNSMRHSFHMLYGSKRAESWAGAAPSATPVRSRRFDNSLSRTKAARSAICCDCRRQRGVAPQQHRLGRQPALWLGDGDQIGAPAVRQAGLDAGKIDRRLEVAQRIDQPVHVRLCTGQARPPASSSSAAGSRAALGYRCFGAAWVCCKALLGALEQFALPLDRVAIDAGMGAARHCVLVRARLGIGAGQVRLGDDHADAAGGVARCATILRPGAAV